MVSGQRTLKLEVLVLCYYFVGVPIYHNNNNTHGGWPAGVFKGCTCVCIILLTASVCAQCKENPLARLVVITSRCAFRL